MLGYVRTDRAELRVREDVFYRALYCGLCHRMGKCTGNCSRMTLNYDFVFLAAVRLSLTGEAPTVKKQRCFLHPFRSRPTVQACKSLDYCADASALLVYHKLLDDLHDEKGLKKALKSIVAEFEKYTKSEYFDIVIVHTDNLPLATELQTMLEGVCGFKPEIKIMGPIIGAHVGPNAVAYAFISNEERPV